MKHLHNLGVAALAITGCLLAALGRDWLEVGYGLHPAIAFPCALAVLWTALTLPAFAPEADYG